MPQPSRTLGQMVNTRPVRRNMTPQEWAALQAQGSQGMQPQVAPMSLADLAMEGVGSFLDEADVSKYLLPATLLGLVRYKKPGVSAAARETAERYHRRPTDDVIQGRDTVFHATEPGIVPEILQTGEIRPNPTEVQDLGLKNWGEYRKLKGIGTPEGKHVRGLPAGVIDKLKGYALQRGISPEKIAAAEQKFLTKPQFGESISEWELGPFMSNLFGYDAAQEILAKVGYTFSPVDMAKDPWMGVSVSRVPRVKSEAHRAVSFEIPREKMPRSRPFAETGYGKTPGSRPSPDQAFDMPNNDAPEMNRFFEFEDRTYNHSIPLGSVRSAWIDNSALKGSEYIGAKKLKDMLAEAGIPVREFRSGREMHSGRARKPLKPPAGMKKHPRDMTRADWDEWADEQRRRAVETQK